jgi:hypothetical protein
MIGFLGNFFSEISLELHQIDHNQDSIKTEWTLKMTSPLPWKPRLIIPGWSELKLNQDGLINSHIDYWHLSPWEVLKQNLFGFKQDSQ